MLLPAGSEETRFVVVRDWTFCVSVPVLPTKLEVPPYVAVIV